ncbi:hypothetical protein [Mycobacterium avium]|uniref:hypothetical protein n=1 Tax=Mycobacterium avium TaxID=1764 RepID=UPI0011553BF7|nr:hypothetical protein [Mycobacterium avium]
MISEASSRHQYVQVDGAIHADLDRNPEPATRRPFPVLRQAFDEKFALILDDPKAYGDYDKDTDQWTAEFAEGRGLVTYAVNDEYVKVIVLRIVDFS